MSTHQAFSLPPTLRLLSLSSCVCFLLSVSCGSSVPPILTARLPLPAWAWWQVTAVMSAWVTLPPRLLLLHSRPIPAWGRWHQTLSPYVLLNAATRDWFADSTSTLSCPQHILNGLHSLSLHLQSTFLCSSNTSQSYNPNLYTEFCSLHVLKGLGPYLMNEFSCQEKQRYKNRNCWNVWLHSYKFFNSPKHKPGWKMNNKAGNRKCERLRSLLCLSIVLHVSVSILFSFPL